MIIQNNNKIPHVSAFIRLYGESLEKLACNFERPIVFKRLNKTENRYHDIMARLGQTIYISEEEVGKLGLTDPEILAVIAHEIGHVIYSTNSWQPYCEERADSVAADLGLGKQMISAIEKIIESRKYPQLTSNLVARIHFLQNMMGNK